MNIWVDADACPKPIKEIIFRTATRTKITAIFVANHFFSTPPSLYIKKIQVSSGFDVADNYIVQQLQKGDLVITADIPLADSVITKGGVALNPRGNLYTPDTIKAVLAMRNLNDSLRSCNMISGGAAALSAREIRDFANSLDKYIHSA